MAADRHCDVTRRGRSVKAPADYAAPEVDVLLALLLACAEAPAPPVPKNEPPPLPEVPADAHPALLDPKLLPIERAPATCDARFETTKGPFVIRVTRAWAPLGADRFYNLVKIGFFDDVAFFRVVRGFLAQFGMSGHPQVVAAWKRARIDDDPGPQQANLRGRVTFGAAGRNGRVTQAFINLADNARLDGMGLAPFGEVVDGMDVVDSLYGGYGEEYPRGEGPDQGRLLARGNAWLRREFPHLDYVTDATIVGR